MPQSMRTAHPSRAKALLLRSFLATVRFCRPSLRELWGSFVNKGLQKEPGMWSLEGWGGMVRQNQRPHTVGDCYHLPILWQLSGQLGGEWDPFKIKKKSIWSGRLATPSFSYLTEASMKVLHRWEVDLLILLGNQASMGGSSARAFLESPWRNPSFWKTLSMRGCESKLYLHDTGRNGCHPRKSSYNEARCTRIGSVELANESC